MHEPPSEPPQPIFGRDAFIKKWGSETLAAGFTAVPNTLVSINRFVPPSNRLTPAEMIVLIAIVSYWWEIETWPFPSIKRLSRDTSISDRHLKRLTKSIERKGYMDIIKIEAGFNISSNMYDLSKTVRIVTTHSERENASRRQRRRMMERD